eukprot:858699-Ditylum_brightwellii.AAC.1
MSTVLAKVLVIVDYGIEEISNLNPGMIDEIIHLKEWYIDYMSEGGEEAEIKEVLTKETWTESIIKKCQEEKEKE